MRNLYVLGHYGTGNLGDEAIFSGIVEMYRNEWVITQLYSVRPTYPRNIVAYKTLSDDFAFEPGRLLVGGGGIPHDASIIDRWLPIMNKALAAGLDVTIEGVGFEGCPIEIRPRLLEFIEPASRVGVRSRRSLNILEELGYSGAEHRPDFAYYLKPDIVAARAIMPIFKNELPLVGLVVGGRHTELLLNFIPSLIDECNMLFIPHVKHMITGANVVIEGERIWSQLVYKTRNAAGEYQCLPFPNTPEVLYGVYKLLDGVVATRYHSFVLAEMAGIKIIPFSGGEKIQAYLDEHPLAHYATGHDIETKIRSVIKQETPSF